MCCACCFLLLPCLALRLKQAKGVVAITWRIEMPIYVHNKCKYKERKAYADAKKRGDYTTMGAIRELLFTVLAK